MTAPLAQHGPRCRRCGEPAAGLVSVTELADAGPAPGSPVAEVLLCGECMVRVAEACGFEGGR